MTVQQTMGALVVGAGDFIRQDRGLTWGIKCRDIGGTQIVMIVIKQSDGSWAIDTVPEGHLDDKFDMRIQEDGFSVSAWFKDVLIPKLNLWLAKRFAPLVAGEVLPPPANLFEEADRAINMLLRITVQADGTLEASIK